MFEDHVNKEITEISETIRLLTSVDHELGKESTALNELKTEFNSVHSKLTAMLEKARTGQIQSFDDFDFDTVLAAWGLIKTVEALRADVERWSRRFVRDTTTFREMLDQVLRERGL
jgi:hypothetical protein